jgi:hypothetical protein
MTAYEPLRTVRKMTGRFALIPSHVTCELNSHESHGAAKGSVSAWTLTVVWVKYTKLLCGSGSCGIAC